VLVLVDQRIKTESKEARPQLLSSRVPWVRTVKEAVVEGSTVTEPVELGLRVVEEVTG